MKNLLTILVAGSCLFRAGCSTDDGSGDTGSSKGRGAGGYEAMQKLGARTGGDVDCSAFKSQRQAQRSLLPGDPNGLDADGDGRACASLPCPCAEVKVQRTPAEKQAVRQSGSTFTAPVLWVSDGDTINVAKPGGGEEGIRLIGIDTPEVYGEVECGGPQASAAMKKLAVGRVRLTTDPTQDRRDRYGRLLASVNKRPVDLGRPIIARGVASVYVDDDYCKRFSSYNRAENSATDADRGSWKHCDITVD